MILREYQSTDCKELAELFYSTVVDADIIAGFGDIDKTGYFDRFMQSVRVGSSREHCYVCFYYSKTFF